MTRGQENTVMEQYMNGVWAAGVFSPQKRWPKRTVFKYLKEGNLWKKKTYFYSSLWQN